MARVRRSLGTSRIGHTGTLDPLATGVLPLVVGRATRLAALLSAADKEYEAAVRLGLATETYDAAQLTGPAAPPPPGITAHAIESALDGFRGRFEQLPPAYSAKKINGVAAYKLARRNEPVQPRSVIVTVHSLTLESYTDGLAVLRVRSGAGFYVRSLAHDLGVRLGCGGHLERLRRVQAASFGESSAVPLQEIEAAGPAASRWLVPLAQLLPHLPQVILNDRGVRRAIHGNDVSTDDVAVTPGEVTGLPADARWRLIDTAGTLLGIAEAGPAGVLHPVVVLV
ncbi:MAG: tRNA pseudouridine55 synthase [Acidobacteriota bacterium]